MRRTLAPLVTDWSLPASTRAGAATTDWLLVWLVLLLLLDVEVTRLELVTEELLVVGVGLLVGAALLVLVGGGVDLVAPLPPPQAVMQQLSSAVAAS